MKEIIQESVKVKEKMKRQSRGQKKKKMILDQFTINLVHKQENQRAQERKDQKKKLQRLISTEIPSKSPLVTKTVPRLPIISII